MRSILLTLLVMVGIATGQTLQHRELLGRPTASSVLVQVIPEDSADIRVFFGTISGALDKQTSWTTVGPSEPANITISGLSANTRYHYQVEHRPRQGAPSTLRPEFTFQTQRAKGAPFTFVIQADPHLDEQSDTSVYLRTLRNELEDEPDFMIDLGDILMSDKLTNAQKKVPRDTITYRAHLLRSFYEEACHSVPLFITLGNHEGEAGWLNNGTAENVPVWGTIDRKKYFVNPEPDGFYTGDTTQYPFVGRRGAYYSWEWGDALFIVIDPYWFTKPKPDSLNGWRWTLGREQYEWLRATLAKSTATFKFVFSHQLVGGDPDGRGGVEFADLYEWGGKNLDRSEGFAKNRPGWEMPIKDLLKRHRVNVFFHGHDHFFGKQEKDCLIYQEVPQPSHTNFSGAGQAVKYGYLEGVILPNSGHMRVSVSPDAVKIDYVRSYPPKNESASRKNKDVSATYIIGAKNCYDSVATSIPIFWNTDYLEEHVYPNPSAEQMSIAFTLPKPDVVSIDIVDGQGALVRTLVRQTPVDGGRYTVIWDGMTDTGLVAAAGTYRYILNGRTIGGASGTLVRMR
ncbi:MAG: metallophosphoesterase [Candidatus Kapabacteria bacterium]|nr:metallophosphoesterase [Candidatus Kapabacteria bacterium]